MCAVVAFLLVFNSLRVNSTIGKIQISYVCLNSIFFCFVEVLQNDTKI